MYNKIKSEAGITIITLMISVVVIIILASISIRMILSDNSIIKKSEGFQNSLTSTETNTQNFREETYNDIISNSNSDDESNNAFDFNITLSSTTAKEVSIATNVYGNSIKKYTIKIAKTSDLEKYEIKEISATTSPIIIKDLDSGEKYTIKITAINDKGFKATKTNSVTVQ